MTYFHKVACEILASRNAEPVYAGAYTPLIWVDTPDGPIFFAGL